MKIEHIWSTPNGDELIAYLARVSNPDNQDNVATAPKLIRYLMSHGHWSPFEMANACVGVETTRDVSRQILRHQSFHFQEFSGRYAEHEDKPTLREARLQDKKNRQASITTDDKDLNGWWFQAQLKVWDFCYAIYKEALKRGIAKEVARVVLPEGIVPTKLYINGTIRSWVHYFNVRCDEATQKEHRDVANAIKEVVFQHYPMVKEAYENDHQTV